MKSIGVSFDKNDWPNMTTRYFIKFKYGMMIIHIHVYQGIY